MTDKKPVYAYTKYINRRQGNRVYGGSLFERIEKNGVSRLGKKIYDSLDTHAFTTKKDAREHLKEYCEARGYQIVWKTM
jgi:hypothetical protein